jgi:hypothetical protein
MQPLRYLFVVLAVLFVVGVAYQVFLAGMAVFGAGQWSNHVDFGYLVTGIPVLLIVAALLARAGRATVWLTIGTLIVAQVQTILPWFKEVLPWVSALHPVNAMVIFGMGVVIVRRAVALARSEASAPEPGADAARVSA